MEWINGEFLLTDAVARVDTQRTYELLAQTYWGVRRPYEVVEKMINHSLCFTLLHDDTQVGFGRAVTDYTVFSWIADIIIDPRYRGKGLGKWLMSSIVQHPLLQGTHMVLQTRDAHGLYEKYGFAQSAALMSTALQHGTQPV
jgi:GNAT superfamily N-acetyltransferase